MRKEYLTVIKLFAEDTTIERDNHTLGLITAPVASWCLLCTAGGSGMCIHCSQSLYIQYHHWTEGRPTPKPATSEWCRWMQPGSTDVPSTTKPAWQLKCQKLPTSTKEAVYRKQLTKTERNSTEGLSGRFNVFGENKAKVETVRPGSKMFFLDHPAVENFFASLREDSAKRQETQPWENNC
jgi:hypothetical protein